jgi:hypothetical protein
MNAPQEDKLLNILSLVQHIKTTLLEVLFLGLLFQLHANFGIYYTEAISLFVQYIHVC